MTDWHPDADELVGLALAEATATDQERLLAHLSSCPSCHEQYAGLIDGVQRALAATPAVAPPAGFSGRVLAGMGTPETVPDANAGRRWPRWSVLVAAAIGVVVGVGAAEGLQQRLGEGAVLLQSRHRSSHRHTRCPPPSRSSAPPCLAPMAARRDGRRCSYDFRWIRSRRPKEGPNRLLRRTASRRFVGRSA